MSGLANSQENLILNRYFRTDPGSIRPSAVYVALLDALPTDDAGTGISEPSMTGYARQQITQADGNWSDPSTGQQGEIDNVSEVDFGTWTAGGPERVIGIAIYDAVSAGTLLWWGALANAWQGFSSAASDEEFHCIGHGYSVDDRVFVRGENLSTGVNEATEYYVGTVPSSDVFTLSTTASNGNPVALTADGWGEVAASNGRDIQNNDQVKIPAGDLDLSLA